MVDKMVVRRACFSSAPQEALNVDRRGQEESGCCKAEAVDNAEGDCGGHRDVCTKYPGRCAAWVARAGHARWLRNSWNGRRLLAAVVFLLGGWCGPHHGCVANTSSSGVETTAGGGTTPRPDWLSKRQARVRLCVSGLAPCGWFLA